jgi:hypothetical protein
MTKKKAAEEPKEPQRRSRRTERYRGILGDSSPAEWVEEELRTEASNRAWEASEGKQVVSVRLRTDAIGLLDAFSLRFNKSRAAMLEKLICGGLGAAFRALPEDEQAAMLKATKIKLPDGEITFADLIKTAEAEENAEAEYYEKRRKEREEAEKAGKPYKNPDPVEA